MAKIVTYVIYFSNQNLEGSRNLANHEEKQHSPSTAESDSFGTQILDSPPPQKIIIITIIINIYMDNVRICYNLKIDGRQMSSENNKWKL